jgi:CBS domain-containing protein
MAIVDAAGGADLRLQRGGFEKGGNAMLVKEVMSKDLAFCIASDTAQAAARTMRLRGVGALPVVSDAEHRTLLGVVTDRDLCCGVIAEAKLAETTKIADVMTCNPVTCAPENTLDDCEKLMQVHQVRRLPVVNAKGECVGMIAQADVVLHAPASKVAKTLAEISKATRIVHGVHTAVA